MARTAVALALSGPERQLLERWANDHPLYRTRQRAKIVLLAAEGVPNRTIATLVGLNQNNVATWRKRYAALGAVGLLDLPRSGRPRKNLRAIDDPGSILRGDGAGHDRQPVGPAAGDVPLDQADRLQPLDDHTERLSHAVAEPGGQGADEQTILVVDRAFGGEDSEECDSSRGEVVALAGVALRHVDLLSVRSGVSVLTHDRMAADPGSRRNGHTFREAHNDGTEGA